MEPVAQSVRALVCGTRGRGFNSHQAPHLLIPTPRSSRGLGRRPFTAVARVRIPYAVQSRLALLIGFFYVHYRLDNKICSLYVSVTIKPS